MHQISRKNSKLSPIGDGKEETVSEFEVSNTRFNISLCIWVEYRERWDKLKLWIRASTLVTDLGNIWSRLK